jgi:SAM-dependent methyltransferase
VASDFRDVSDDGPTLSPKALIQREAFRLLMSSEGQTLLAELSSKPIAESDEVRVLTRYRARYAPEMVNAVFAQIKLRARARAKFSRADRMYFTADGLEQASTERMAHYHAQQFVAHEMIADLCCGIGGDLIAFAEAHHVFAVDIDDLALRLASANAGAYGRGHNVHPIQGDVDLLGISGERMAAFIDPARRVDGRRLPAGASQPSLAWCIAFGQTMPTLVKASPALPLDLVPAEWGIEFVSEGRELKESLLSSPRMNRVGRRATVLSPEANTLLPIDGDETLVREPGRYLLDPDPAVTRAGLVEDLARSLSSTGDVWKIDHEVAFLTGDAAMETPFGRSLEILASLPWNLNRLKESLRALDIGSVDIRKRGSAVDVDDIQRRLKLTGSRSATVVLTRVDNKPWAFVCT